MRKHYEYRRAVLTQAALQKIHAETNRYWVRETGGALVGYVDAQLTLVIVDACGPGERAKRLFQHVVIDGAAATAFCERWRKKTAEVIDYVGDWHSHVSSSTRPSNTDIEAMQTMKDYTPNQLFPPVSLIVARFTLRHEIFILRKDRLTSIHSEVMPDNVVKPSWYRS